MKIKHKFKKKTLVTIIVFLIAISGFIVYGGFTGNIQYQGHVNTANIEFEIVEYSGTWVYKDLITGECIILPYEDANPHYMLVAYGKAQQGTIGYDVDFIFDNIFPCIYFKADFIAHYIGSIPVHLNGMKFDVDEQLKPYISWEAYKCTYENNRYIKGEKVELGYQLHHCMYIWVDVIVKLPQDDRLQDIYTKFYGSLDVIQWNEYCYKIVSVPDVDVNMKCYKTNPDSYFLVTLSNVPVGYDVTNGNYLGWCVDQSTNMPLDQLITCHLYNEYSLYPDDDWDKVNYLINHKHPDATKQDIQDAIWYFIDGGVYPTDPEAKSMVDDANINGEGFIPKTGQYYAILINSEYQKIFIEVDP